MSLVTSNLQGQHHFLWPWVCQSYLHLLWLFTDYLSIKPNNQTCLVLSKLKWAWSFTSQATLYSRSMCLESCLSCLLTLSQQQIHPYHASAELHAAAATSNSSQVNPPEPTTPGHTPQTPGYTRAAGGEPQFNTPANPRAAHCSHFYSWYGYCMGVLYPSCQEKYMHNDGTADSTEWWHQSHIIMVSIWAWWFIWYS
jgi:hypothetical protein